MSDPVPGALHRYTLPVDRASSEVVAATLWAVGARGVWERPGELVAWFDSRQVSGLPPGGTFTVEPERDWQAEWKATISPVSAGRFRVVPTWSIDDHVADDDEVTLVLDPASAFGSGHHATTAQCLELLDELVVEDGRQPGDLTDVTVADVGCGSGILAIAAARRGARVVAVDTDPHAVEVTRDNAARNGAEVVVATGSVQAATAELGGPAQVVVANLVTDTVAQLADELVAAVAPGGRLVVSGVTVERAAVATGPLTTAGLAIEERRERDGWVALAGSRPSAAAHQDPTTGPGGGGRPGR